MWAEPDVGFPGYFVAVVFAGSIPVSPTGLTSFSEYVRLQLNKVALGNWLAHQTVNLASSELVSSNLSVTTIT